MEKDKTKRRVKNDRKKSQILVRKMGERKYIDHSGKSTKSQPTWKNVSSCAGDQKKYTCA